jgi:hypothetical protein
LAPIATDPGLAVSVIAEFVRVSLAERLLEGLAPSEDGTSADRRSLDVAIVRATELGYRLT